MRGRDVFGVIVRTSGLLVTLHALSQLQVLFTTFGGMGEWLDRAGFSRGGFFVGVLGQTALGLALLFQAHNIVRLAYRRPARHGVAGRQGAAGKPKRYRQGHFSPTHPPDFGQLTDEG